MSGFPSTSIALRAIASRVTRCGAFLRIGKYAFPIDDPSEYGTIRKANSGTALINVADGQFLAYASIQMADVRYGATASFNIGNPKNALNSQDLSSYAQLNSYTSRLQLIPGAGNYGLPYKKAFVYPVTVNTVVTSDQFNATAGSFSGAEAGDDLIDTSGPATVPQGSFIQQYVNTTQIYGRHNALSTATGHLFRWGCNPAKIYIGYQMGNSVTNTWVCRWGGATMTAHTNETFVLPFSTAATIAKISLKDLADDATYGYDPNSWNFNSKDILIEASAGTGAGANDYLRVFFVAIVVRHRPSVNLISTEKFNGYVLDTKKSSSNIVPYNYRLDASYEGPGEHHVFRRDTTPAVYELDSEFLFNTVGFSDDSAGTYTGSASGSLNILIQNPADIVRHMASIYGGLNSTTGFETNTLAPGSFTDARQQLAADSVTLSAYFGRLTNVGRAIEDIASEALCWFYRDRFTDKMHAIAWRAAPAVNYSYTFKWDDILNSTFSAGLTSDTEVVNRVQVKYGWDETNHKQLYDTHVAPADSSNGPDNAYARDTTREATATASAARYGPKEADLNSTMIRKNAPALSVMRRVFDGRVEPRVVASFSTLAAPDLSRGQVIQFDGTVDPYLPYPKPGSNGSWVGKTFWVVEVQQSLGPEYHQDITAVEA